MTTIARFLIIALLGGVVLIGTAAGQGDGLSGPPARLEAFRLRVAGLDGLPEISEASPRFSWALRALDSASLDLDQCAYRIEVHRGFDETVDHLLWDSGLVRDRETQHRPYRGPPLTSRGRYRWRVWVQDRPSGALRPSAWMCFRSGILPGDVLAGRFIGSPLVMPANGPRPQGFQWSLVRVPDQPHRLVVDLGRIVTPDRVVIHPCRSREGGLDGRVVGFPRRFYVHLAPDETGGDLLMDASGQDFDLGARTCLEVPVHGARGRFLVLDTLVAEPFAADIDVLALAEIEVFAGGRNLALRAPVHAQDSREEGGWSARYLTNGIVERPVEDRRASGPVLRFHRTIGCGRRIEDGLIRIACLGAFDLRVNGELVTGERLAPGRSRWPSRMLLCSIDLRPHLRPGANEISVDLASGWYADRQPDLFGSEQDRPDSRPGFSAEIQILDEEGDRLVGSDESWSWRIGDVIDQGIRSGETIDARRRAGDQPLDQPAVILGLPAGIEIRSRAEGGQVARDEVVPVVVGRRADGSYLVDFGRVLSGTIRLDLAGPEGSLVEVDLAEVVDDHGEIDALAQNWLTLGRFQHHEFILSAAPVDRFEPRFSTGAFRYLRVRGAIDDLGVDAIRAVEIGQDLRPTASLRQDQTELARLIEAALASLRANAQDLPVDCPGRERQPWLRDGQVVARSYLGRFALLPWYDRWLDEIQAGQCSDGFVPSIVPGPASLSRSVGDGPPRLADPWWAGVIGSLPLVLYAEDGDRTRLEGAREPLRRWLAWCRARSVDGLLREGIGDWQDFSIPGRARTPIAIMATSGWLEGLDALRRMALVLGDEEEAKRVEGEVDELRSRLRSLLQAEVAAGRVIEPGFAALALHQGWPRDESEVADLESRLLAGGERMDGGYVQAPLLLDQLIERGFARRALEKLLGHDSPSFQALLDLGLASLPEGWTVDPRSNRLHQPLAFVLAEVDRLLGMPQPVLDEPAYRLSRIAPTPWGPGASAEILRETPRGDIRLRWRQGEDFEFEIDLPPGCRAEVLVPEGFRAAGGDRVLVLGPGRHRHRCSPRR
ncbi:MAG: family 78 glycoside hydrolase catalytic domain [Planctomycetes bacterium]|nr:family 78 glycoside hydrolase catalytic domain [Planctomycetota bacterium]